MLGFTFRIQDLAQFIEVEIGYLVVAFPPQVNSCRAFVRVFANAQNRCLNFGFHSRSFLSCMTLDDSYLSPLSRLCNAA